MSSRWLTVLLACCSICVAAAFICNTEDGRSCAELGQLPCTADGGNCVPCNAKEYYNNETATCNDCPTGAASCADASRATSCEVDHHLSSAHFCCRGNDTCASRFRESCTNHSEPCGACLIGYTEHVDACIPASSSSSTGPSSRDKWASIPTVTTSEMEQLSLPSGAVRASITLTVNQTFTTEQWEEYLADLLSMMGSLPAERLKIHGRDGDLLFFDILPATDTLKAGLTCAEAFARLEKSLGSSRTIKRVTVVEASSSGLSTKSIALIAISGVAVLVIVGILFGLWMQRRHERLEAPKPRVTKHDSMYRIDKGENEADGSERSERRDTNMDTADTPPETHVNGYFLPSDDP